MLWPTTVWFHWAVENKIECFEKNSSTNSSVTSFQPSPGIFQAIWLQSHVFFIVGETKVAFLEEQYSKNNAIKSKNLILGLQARDEAAMLVVNTIIYFQWIYTKMELVPSEEKCICPCSPTWPPWSRVQTSNWDFQPIKNCCPNLMRRFRRINPVMKPSTTR